VIVVVKCGNPEEANDPKPGNRGKRDSQVILMNFLNRVIFNDRMTPLDYELTYQIQKTANVFPDRYDLVLMVDADTKVKPESLNYMVKAMVCDEKIMGLCGETRVYNKTDSFITQIQVFEYYISHHLSKAFESVFGGVTCLPGCFCMYRIKSRKPNTNYIIPILANPDIIAEYSQNIVKSLHQKNLLLLGEDRFLSTLMLKNFTKSNKKKKKKKNLKKNKIYIYIYISYSIFYYYYIYTIYILLFIISIYIYIYIYIYFFFFFKIFFFFIFILL